MAVEFKFPDVGEGIAEGTIVKWRFKTGDSVREHETIVEIETDKAVVQIPSPVSGALLEIRRKEGEVVKVGEVLAVIGEAGEKVSMLKSAEAAPPAARPAAKKFYGIVGELEEAPPEEEEAKPAKPAALPVQEKPAIARAEATPAVRALAKKMGVDIEKVHGTGQGGRVTGEDLQLAKTAAATAAKPMDAARVARREFDLYGYLDKVPLAGVRRAAARHVAEAWQKQALVTAMDDADVTELAAHKEKEAPGLKAKGVHLTFMPFIVKAATAVLKKHPYVNSALDDEKQEIVLKKYYNVGIAVDTPEGLIVPILKRAETKSIVEIAKEIPELAEKARARTLDLADVQGGTFTITNYGSLGGTYATPIPNYPESSILGIGRIEERAVVREGKVTIRKIMPLSLTFDHRVFDGAEASRFLTDLRAYLEDPDIILME